MEAELGGIAIETAMSRVQSFAEITPDLPFTEYDFYDLYRTTFENTELGRMKKVLPLHERASNFGLSHESLQPKRGRKSYFTPEGKVALMSLKMYTGLSFPKLMEQLNANVHFQIFCDIITAPTHPLTNDKVLDDIVAELSTKLRIQRQQDLPTEVGKPCCGKDSGKMRNVLSESVPCGEVSEITFQVSSAGLSAPSFQIHMRYILLDTKTGYRSQYKALSTLASCIAATE